MRLLSVHAHPDDEASKGAATVAKYVSEGHRVRVVTCTGGERGDVLNPRLQSDAGIAERLAEVRRQEMARAVEALGIEHVWLGFEDSGLPEGDPLPPLPEGSFATLPLDVTVPRLVAQLREFRPHVVVTYNEQGGYPHPDHIMTHQITMAALDSAADPEYQPALGAAWQVQKVYYDVGFSLERLTAVHDAMRERGMESPFADWIARREQTPRRHVTARVEVSDWFPQRDEALRAHATQVDPEGFFFAVPRDVEREVWPWEEFELARSLVPVEEPEPCLFTGIEEE